MLRALTIVLVLATPAAADVEQADLPRSPNDLDAELTTIDPRRAMADVLRGLGIRHRADQLGTFEDDAFLFVTTSHTSRVIDVDLMHARDCAFDRVRGGACVLRGFDQPDPIDIAAYGAGNAQRQRFEMLERMADSVDALR